MAGVIVLFVWITVIIVVVISNKKARDASKNQKDSVMPARSVNNKQHMTQAELKQNVVNMQNRLDVAGYKSPKVQNFRELEDRQNDWLAKQIREERQYNPIVDDMLKLKIEHARECDARLAQSDYRR